MAQWLGAWSALPEDLAPTWAAQNSVECQLQENQHPHADIHADRAPTHKIKINQKKVKNLKTRSTFCCIATLIWEHRGARVRSKGGQIQASTPCHRWPASVL